jgi:hypothetical protein
MAMSNTFNPIAFAERLAAGGFTEQQAQTLAKAIYDLIDSELVTKADLAAFSLEVDRKLEKLKAELIQWMFGAIVLQTGITAVLFKLMH